MRSDSHGHKRFDLTDPEAIKSLNALLGSAGISFQENLTGVYVLIDMDRYRRFSRRKAGRRTVITKDIRYQVYTLRSEKNSYQEIARLTSLATGTISKILKDFEEETESEQLTIFDF